MGYMWGKGRHCSGCCWCIRRLCWPAPPARPTADVSGGGQHMYIVAIFHAKQYFVTVANPPLKMQFSKLTFEISRLTFSIH